MTEDEARKTGCPLENIVILPGSRVLVFAPSLFIDDVATPLSFTMKTATVLRRYGYVSEWMEQEYGRDAAKYPDLIDVVFDHDMRVSRGHFTDGVEAI